MTTVGYVGGIDYNRYQQYQTQGMQTNPYYNMDAGYSQSDAYVSSSGETCTDGKDDGKIGFFGAIGNAIKGVGKAIGNGIKGMFTGKDGKFSLGKTLLSIGTAVACAACPAVLVATCVVGGAMGAVQVGKGVYKAATAETDAEAKQAWQDIGGGSFTVAASVAGAKGGIKAMQNGAINATGASALQALKGQKFSFKNTAKAFAKDSYNSGVHNLKNLSKTASTYANNAKNSIKEVKADPSSIKEFVKTKAKNVKKQTSDKVNEFKSGIKDTVKNRSKYQKAQSEYKTAAKAYDDAIKNGWTDDAFAAADDLKFAQDRLLAAESNYKFSGYEQKLNYALKHPVKAAKQTWATGKNIWNSSKGKVSKANAENLWSGIQDAYNKNIKGQTLSQLGNKLTGTAKNIWSDLSTGKYSYQEAVSQYGYESVAHVIQTMGGGLYASEAI